MEEKEEQLKDLYEKLTEANKEVLNLLASGMKIAQETEKEK